MPPRKALAKPLSENAACIARSKDTGERTMPRHKCRADVAFRHLQDDLTQRRVDINDVGVEDECVFDAQLARVRIIHLRAQQQF